MLEALQKTTAKLLRIENAPSIIALIVSFAVALLNFWNQVDQNTVLTFLLVSIGVLALGALVERITYLDRIESRIENLSHHTNLRGITQVFERRDQLPEYQSYILQAKTEILITGLALTNTTIRFLDLLKGKAKTGCSIKILLLAPPEDEEGQIVLRSLGRMLGASEEMIKNQIETSLGYLGGSLKTLDAKSKERIEVRTYRFNPTYGVLSVDGLLPTGKILLGLYPYQCSEVHWPVLELKRHDNHPSLYEFFYERTKQMWLDATPVNISDLKTW